MVEIKNCNWGVDGNYIVARNVDGELWYYGTYISEARAKEVAEMVNGIVVYKR